MRRMLHRVMALGMFVFAICFCSVGYAQNDIVIEDEDKTYSSAVTADSISINGNSTVTFDSTITVTNGIEIMDGAANTTFTGAVTADHLAIDTEPGAASSTNKFEDTLTLSGRDPDITGRSVSLVVGDGTNTFEKDVSTGNADAIFAKSTSTFNAHLNADTETVDIGYSDFMREVEAIEGRTGHYNKPATVILDGASAKITADEVNVYQNGTLRFDSAGTVDGKLNVLSGGAVISGTGAVTITDELSINGNSTANFGGVLSVTNGIEVMDGAANTTFGGNVSASHFAIDTIRGAGSSTNTFKATLTLNGQDPDISNRAVSLVVGDGTNTFTGAVITGGKDAIFAKSTSTFNTGLNAGTGIVDIGYSDFVKNVESEPEKGNGYFNQNATVSLGNSASITAANVNVYEKGILKIAGNATVTGNLNFKAGSTFEIDAANELSVTGATSIENGAMANIQSARGTSSIGNVVALFHRRLHGWRFHRHRPLYCRKGRKRPQNHRYKHG